MVQSITETAPAWLDEAMSIYRAGIASTILFYGSGVSDYADHPIRDLAVADFLGIAFAGQFTVASYAPDLGITFNGPKSVAGPARERFLAVTGQGAAPQKSESDLIIEQAVRKDASPSRDPDLPSSPGSAIPLLFEFLRKANGDPRQPNGRGGDGSGKRSMVIIDRLDLIAPPSDKAVISDAKAALLSALHRIGKDPEVDAMNNLLIMLSPSLEEVHPDLRTASSGIVMIEIPPPNFEERHAYIRKIFAMKEEEKPVKCELSTEQLAAQTAGLFRRDIENMVMRAEYESKDKPSIVITRELVKSQKAAAFKAEYSGVLEILEPDIDWSDVGGHEVAKGYLERYVLAPMNDPDLWEVVPLACLLVGPPGTGKTYLAMALAQASGINCALLRAENIKGSLVGESEKRLAKAFSGLNALSPCLVFIDELDQKTRRSEANAGDGGSAVESNIFGRLLEFIGDPSHRGRIFVLGASNRAGLIDPALKRSGRFGDLIIPILPPSDVNETLDVLKVQLRGFGYDCDSFDASQQQALVEIATTMNRWTQAQIGRIVVMARGLSRIEGKSIIEGLMEARSSLRTTVAANERMIVEALAACDNIALVPEGWRSYVAVEAPADDEDGYQPRRRGIRDVDF